MDIDLFNYWRELSKDNEELSNAFKAQEEDELIPKAFFRYFRPTGIGLEPYFNGLPHGAEIYKRIQNIYGATSSSDPESEFFVVENPKALTEGELVGLGEKYIQFIRGIFTDLNDPGFLSQNISIHIIKGKAPKTLPLPKHVERIYDVPEGELYEGDLQNAANDIKGWYLGELDIMHVKYIYQLDKCICNMLEADNTPYLDGYVLYPLIVGKTPMNDPYSIEFDLWKYNAKAVFFNDSTLNIYVNDYI